MDMRPFVVVVCHMADSMESSPRVHKNVKISKLSNIGITFIKIKEI